MAAMGGPDVTVVVPVLHDSPALARLLDEPCTYDHGARWIVVNGGARDEALNVLRAARPDVLWLDSPPGRGVQIGAAVPHAVGTWLLVLHADTQLPDRWRDELSGGRQCIMEGWRGVGLCRSFQILR